LLFKEAAPNQLINSEGKKFLTNFKKRTMKSSNNISETLKEEKQNIPSKTFLNV
jgi:hypothetical protein